MFEKKIPQPKIQDKIKKIHLPFLSFRKKTMRSLLLNVDFVETSVCLMHPCFADEPYESLTLLFLHREMAAFFSIFYVEFLIQLLFIRSFR